MIQSLLKRQQSLAPAFGRQLRSDEIPEYRKTVQQGLDVLSIETLAMILPAPAFPSDPSEDVGIGSPLTGGGKRFMNWIGELGFNTVQYLPNGNLPQTDPSPYTSDSFSGNTLLVALQDLASPEWGRLLSQKTFDDIVQSRPEKTTVRHPERYGPGFIPTKETQLSGSHIIDYPYIAKRGHQALSEAYRNFIAKKDTDPVVRQLYQDYQEFLANLHTRYWLKNDSLYEGLSALYQSERSTEWGKKGQNSEFRISAKPDMDRHLFDRRKVAEADAEQRIQKLEADPRFKQEQDLYQFKQFVLTRQQLQLQDHNREQAKQLAQQTGHTEWADKLTVKTMADGPVSPSHRDTWTHLEAFLHGWKLHCPPNTYWSFPVLDFQKMAGSDGKLGAAGRFVYERFHKLFRENTGGARVDHAPGLIDPWVGPDGHGGASPELRRLRSAPDHPQLKAFSVLKPEQIDLTKSRTDFDHYRSHSDDPKHITNAQIDTYSEPLRKTVVQAAKDTGVPVDHIMFEELDFNSPVPQRVMEQNGWSKIRLTRWGTDRIRPQDWVTTGNHDFKGLQEWATDVLKSPEHEKQAQLKDLGNALQLSPKEREQLGKNPDAFVEKQFVKLFSTPAKHLQVMFLDALGRPDRYHYDNRPDPINWRLRLTPDTQKEYYQALSQGKGLNLPHILQESIELRQKKVPQESLPMPADLSERLQRFASILKEPEKTA